MEETLRGRVKLALGCVRSGKSRNAQELAEPASRITSIATARPGDHAVLMAAGLRLPAKSGRTGSQPLPAGAIG